MRIVELELTALTGATVDGGWPQDLEAEENLHTLVRVRSAEGGGGMSSRRRMPGGGWEKKGGRGTRGVG